MTVAVVFTGQLRIELLWTEEVHLDSRIFTGISAQALDYIVHRMFRALPGKSVTLTKSIHRKWVNVGHAHRGPTTLGLLRMPVAQHR